MDFGDLNDVGLENTTGLDLIRDEYDTPCLVLPHFIDSWLPSAQELADGYGFAVIGIEENAGVLIEGREWRFVGDGNTAIIPPAGQ